MQQQRGADQLGPGLGLVRAERQRRADQWLPGDPGHGEPEHRALAMLAPGLQPAVVQPGVLQSDGQAEPGPAGGPGAGRVGPPEPVEHELRLGRPEAAAMVPDGDRDRVPVPGHGDHHVPSLTVLDRVVQQVAQDPLDAAPVHLGQARLGGQPEIDPGAAPRGELLGVGRGPPDQVADVRRLGVQGGRVGVVPADLQQVGEQRLEPLQLALEQLRGPRRSGQQVLARREQHVRGDPDRGQRGTQLVRHVGHELPLHLGQFLQLAQLLLQAGRHVVERAGQRGQVVGAADRHPLLELAVGQPLGRLGRLPDRHHHPPGDQRDDAHQQHDQGQPAAEHGPLHQGQRLLLLAHREQVVQLGVRADHAADGQAGNRRPACQVAHLRRGGHQVVGAAFLLFLGHAGDQLLGQAGRAEVPVAVFTDERGAVQPAGSGSPRRTCPPARSGPAGRRSAGSAPWTGPRPCPPGPGRSWPCTGPR